MEAQQSSQQQRQVQYSANNYAFVSENALQMRLDTSKLLDEIQMYLEGKEWVLEEDDKGKKVPVKKKIPNCKPKANTEGINSLMFRVKSLMNQAIVMGNFTEEMFKDRLSEMRKSLARDLVINMQTWELEENSLYLVCDGIMDSMWAFMSRLINNEERKSLTPGSKTEQQSEVTYPGGVFKK